MLEAMLEGTRISVWIESGSDHGKQPPDSRMRDETRNPKNFATLEEAIAAAQAYKDSSGWSWAYVRLDFPR